MIGYLDSSVLAAAYLEDERGHAAVRQLLDEPSDPLVTAELAALEVASSLLRAKRAGRAASAFSLLVRLDADLQRGLVNVLPVSEEAMGLARSVLLAAPVSASDAIHIASAIRVGESLRQQVTFHTADRQQARAAEAVGLQVA